MNHCESFQDKTENDKALGEYIEPIHESPVLPEEGVIPAEGMEPVAIRGDSTAINGEEVPADGARTLEEEARSLDEKEMQDYPDHVHDLDNGEIKNERPEIDMQ